MREVGTTSLSPRFDKANGNSELHVFRGHQPSPTGFIMGHEFVGEIVELGSEVKGFNIGERVVTPFTSNCGDCFYCSQGYTSRCQKGRLFGCEALDGAQAEYVRVPLAGGTMVRVPEGVKGELVVSILEINGGGNVGTFVGKNGG